ncbi:hypothetical protein, partial [Burkholderia cenocepacia]|uniref:hypothetical protein n=1 Tax=Burkholderia cenocepacia TaxID=95486 RepID=UPI0038CC05C4
AALRGDRPISLAPTAAPAQEPVDADAPADREDDPSRDATPEPTLEVDAGAAQTADEVRCAG